ncbi:MAG: hypothetical protein AAF399_04230 [Bacteroidota bacterium]
MGRFDYLQMRPAQEILYHTPGMTGQAIAETGQQYAIYLSGKAPAEIRLRLAPGTYRYQIVSPDTGTILSEGELTSTDELTKLPMPTQSGYRVGIGIWRK